MKRIFAGVIAGLLSIAPAWATGPTAPFQYEAGTAGYITTPFALETTELNALASGACAISSVGGTSGVFSQTQTLGAPQGDIWFKSGGTFTPAAGGYLAVWFLPLDAAGPTAETAVASCSTTVSGLARSPDAIVALVNAAYASGNLAWAQGRYVTIPANSFKVLVQNLTGGSLPATGDQILLGPWEIGY